MTDATKTTRGAAVTAALNAAVRLAEAVREEQRLTEVIRSAECPLPVSDGYRSNSHLNTFLTKWKTERQEADFHGERWFTPDVEEEWAALRACSACWAAYEAVQGRKAVRLRRGAARAALARIGAAELKRRAQP